MLPRVEQQAAPAAADVDERFARREPHLAAHVVHLVALRLLERGRAVTPVGARVHHRRRVEPLPVERRRAARSGSARSPSPARSMRLEKRHSCQRLRRRTSGWARGRTPRPSPARNASARSPSTSTLAVEIRLEQADVAEHAGTRALRGASGNVSVNAGAASPLRKAVPSARRTRNGISVPAPMLARMRASLPAGFAAVVASRPLGTSR